ncbi:MAG TPA: P-loop NTPase fold protein [Pseudonocardiaceae bacterium]|jgi:CheY-like chemotaxis protein|nr:P-loop NTPase fold protein [Pseudonocardiaceae bacterium]
MTDPRFDAEGFTIVDRAEQQALTVLNDAPVGEGGNDDLMGGRQAAARLASLIVASRRSTPFALAVDAAWGMGKSSLLRQLQRALTDSGAATVWFNAWTGGPAGALEGLIKSVLLGADANVVRRAVRSLARRTRLISGVRVALMLASSFVGLGGVVNDIWHVLAADAKSRNEIRGVLADALRGWADGDNFLVVFVDDLDRCTDERIVEVCEAVKLYLDVPGVVFVLACDQAVLRRAIGAQAAEYLEKIIQLTYQVQAPSDQQAEALVADYLARSGTAGYFDESMRDLVIDRSGRNPRRIKRLINNFVLTYLFPEWAQVGERHLIKIILLQDFYPSFFRMIDREPEVVQDFLTYTEIRGVVKRGGGSQKVGEWRQLFHDKDLNAPPLEVAESELKTYFAELEEQLPVDFPTLAGDRDFVSLVESLTGPLRSGRLRWLLHTPLQPAAGMEVPDQNLDIVRGLTLVWADDQPKANTPLFRELVQHGARVVQVTDRDELLAELARARPDILLSDITRPDDANGGLNDLAHLREERLYNGPVIIYTGSVTMARMRRAQELDVVAITDHPTDALAAIVSVAGGRLPGWPAR